MLPLPLFPARLINLDLLCTHADAVKMRCFLIEIIQKALSLLFYMIKSYLKKIPNSGNLASRIEDENILILSYV